MPEIESVIIQPFLEPGTPPKIGIAMRIVLGSEEDLSRFTDLLRNPHGVLKLTASRGVEQYIFTSEAPRVANLLVYPQCS